MADGKLDHHALPLQGQGIVLVRQGWGERLPDIVWSYRDPLPACSPIEGLLCFLHERVDAIYVDDELLPKPITPWS